MEMENLDIVVTQSKGEITTNFDEVAKALEFQMSAYKDFVVTEDEIQIAKGDLAFLRKLKTSIDDKRKEIKRVYLEPLDAFEDSCKKLTGIIDEPIKTIDEQLKLFEADRIRAKRERVTKMYIEQVGEYLEFLPVDDNFNEKWCNKSYTDDSIRFDISALIQRVKSDLEVIESLNSEIKADVILAYQKAGNSLSAAIQRNSQYLADKAKLAEKAKEAESVKEVQPVKEEPSAMDDLNHLVKTTRMVRFIVSEEDADAVRELLGFSNITYREE